MSLVVHRPGLLTTVQDLGRWGYQSAGVPVAGPMDRWSHRLANLLLGNPDCAAVLEVTVTGPVFECDADTRLAITGAPFAIMVSGAHARSPLMLEAAAGTIVDFGECLAGTRAYVAVAGGFDVPVVLGSRSTDLRAGFGGWEGRALRSRDRLPHATSVARPGVRELRHLPAAPARDSITRLRVMRGPAEDPAADRALAELLSASFRISPRSDRMGYRLEGGTIAAPTGASIVTAPTVMGLVQVPPTGDPILLMADRQTTGGYSAIAVVIDADLAVAGQLGPGHAVSFDACTHDAACLALKEREARLIDLQAIPR